MALRDRGHRLAGYLTPPSDATEQEEEAAAERVIVHCDTNRWVASARQQRRSKVWSMRSHFLSFPVLASYSDKISQTTVLRIEPPWDNNSAPALIKTKEFDHKPEPITRTDETKNVTSTNKVGPHPHTLSHDDDLTLYLPTGLSPGWSSCTEARISADEKLGLRDKRFVLTASA